MLDDHEVVGALILAQEAGGFPLGMQSVQGEDHAGQVQALDARAELGDLIGLRGHFPLGQRAALAHVEGRQQVHLAAIRADGSAGRLAVRGCLRQQAGHRRPAGLRGGAALLPLVPGRLRQRIQRGLRQGRQVPVHHVVEGHRVHPGEDAAERALAGRPYLPGPRVAAPAQDDQDLLGTAACPVRDRGRRVVPDRGKRAHRQREYELQRVPAAQRRTRVRNPRQPLTQARAGHPVRSENRGQLLTRNVDQGR